MGISEPVAVDSPIQRYLDDLHAAVAPLRGGAVADYIPELARVDPRRFAIAIATVDGELYAAGDIAAEFTIQSISKPLVHGLALELRGERAVRSVVGVEPTGEPFNSITLDAQGRPLNPLVNAGALAVAGLVGDGDAELAFERVLTLCSAYAGRALGVDDATARSESATGHRNRAIGHLLAASGVLTSDPTDVVERYFRQCAISLDCRDAAIVAATLANAGVNPRTGEHVAGVETIRHVLLVMATCGMYDGAGEWMYTVGLPAKSGVSGTIIAVLPGQLGIAVHSPPLDRKGNSVRGVEVCRRLSADLGLHLVQPGGREPPVRHTFTLAQQSSKRVRADQEREVLATVGQRAHVLQLQGSLSFSAVEAVIRAVLAEPKETQFVVLDLRRVSHLPDVAVRFLAELADRLTAQEAGLVLSGTGSHVVAARRVARRARARVRTFSELDRALEWCEDQLLDAAAARREPKPIRLADHDLFAGLAGRDAKRVVSLFERRRYAAGAQIIGAGEAGDTIFLVTRGRLTTYLPRGNGELQTIATLVPGMVVGELAFLDRRTHRGVVRADTGVECYALSRSRLDSLREQDPGVQVTIIANLARMLASRADAMREELGRRGPM